MTTAPSSFHQWIVARLWQYIGVPVLDKGLAYVFDAPIGVIMPGCDPVQPDYVVVLTARASIIRDRRIFGVPDLLVEVLSPGNTPYNQDVKLRAYARAGVPEYIIIDPRARTLSHYRLAAENHFADPIIYGSDSDVSFDCLPGISLRVGDLFAGAPDTTL
jgi:Uma2 family endonuclease